MNKTTRSYTVALVLAGLATQGCTQHGDVRPGGSPYAGTASAFGSEAGTAEAPMDANDKAAVRADTRTRFAAVATAVRKEMSPGGRFEFVSRLERQTVERRLADMQALFNRYGAVDKMDANSKVRMFNDQEEINGILTRNDSNRQICTREMPVGTHFPKMVCETYGELRREQMRTTEFLDRPSMQRAKHTMGSPGSVH